MTMLDSKIKIIVIVILSVSYTETSRNPLTEELMLLFA